MTPVDTLMLSYELMVIDHEKLIHYQTECEGGVIKYQEGIWIASASRLVGFTKMLDQYSDSFISFKVPNENCYSFEFIVGNDFSKINDKLDTIGLMLNKTDIEQKFYKIKTIANKTYKQ